MRCQLASGGPHLDQAHSADAECATSPVLRIWNDAVYHPMTRLKSQDELLTFLEAAHSSPLRRECCSRCHVDPIVISQAECCAHDIFVGQSSTLNAKPYTSRWEGRPGITLIGDAAHLMSPFGGAGANLAMLDGATLAMELIKCRDSAAAIPAYEAHMCAHAEPEAQQLAGGLEMCLSKDGAQRLAEQMASYQGQREQQ